MESTSTKLDAIRPVFLKAGIPIAIAAAGFLFARITRRRGSGVDGSRAENQINYRSESCMHDLESLDSSYLSCLDPDHSSPGTSLRISEREPQYQHIHELEEEILDIRSQVKDLQVRELELEIQYLHYRDIKGRELVVMELEKMLLLEMTRAQLLDMDISAEAERQRFQKMVVEYQKIFGLLQFSRCRNRMLRRRIKKLFRKTKEQRQFIREQYKQVEAKEAENSTAYEELEAKTDLIRKLEDEIQEQKTTLWRLQEEKNDPLSSQIELANKTASSKTDAEKVTIEDSCSQVASTMEKLETERPVETEELIYLRWSNACLRHELMRKNQEEEDPKQGKNQVEFKFGEIAYLGLDDEVGHSTLENEHSCLNFPTTTIGHASAHSKRKKFIKKLKRWVEGNEKERHETKPFEGQSVPHGPVQMKCISSIHATNSYSSA